MAGSPGGSATNVFVVGSVNVDLVVRAPRLPAAGETISGGTFERHGGGKGANAAVAAARAGAATALVAAIGQDDEGSWQLRELASDGIDVSGVARIVGAPTGRALIVVAESGDNQIAVASGANAVLDADHVREALLALTPADGAVCLLGFEVGDAAIEAAVAWARERGIRIVLNPAPPRGVTAVVLAAHPILTPNEGEAVALAGERDVEGAARSLAEGTAGPVVATLGAAGVLIAEPGRTAALRIPARNVHAVDTTGAGDCFNGALAARLSFGDSLESAVRWAVAAAALKVTTPGARSSPEVADVDALLTAQDAAAVP
jgi:ribokinase